MLLCCVCSIAHVDENFTIRLKSIAARQCFSSKYVFLIFMNHKSVLHNRVGYTCARKRSIEIRPAYKRAFINWETVAVALSIPTFDFFV